MISHRALLGTKLNLTGLEEVCELVELGHHETERMATKKICDRASGKKKKADEMFHGEKYSSCSQMSNERKFDFTTCGFRI